jgi:hypothetical protein
VKRFDINSPITNPTIPPKMTQVVIFSIFRSNSIIAKPKIIPHPKPTKEAIRVINNVFPKKYPDNEVKLIRISLRIILAFTFFQKNKPQQKAGA